MHRTITRLAGAAAIATLGIGAVAGISAATSTPSSTTTFYGCADKHGNLEEVSTTAPHCDHWATVVTWNSTGPQGAQGNTGAQGPAGPPGAAGGGFTSGTDPSVTIGTATNFLAASSNSDGAGGCNLNLSNVTSTDVTGFEQQGAAVKSYALASGSSDSQNAAGATHYQFQLSTSLGNVSLDYWLAPTGMTTCSSAWRYLVN